MFTFEYTYDDYQQLLYDLAQKLEVPVKYNGIIFPERIASGFFRVYQFPAFQVTVFDCILNDDWHVFRHKDKKEYYSLRFDQLAYTQPMEVNIGGEITQTTETEQVAVAYLTSSLFDWYYRGAKGTHYKAVNILLEKNFIASLLGDGKFESILPAYIGMRTRSLDIQAMSTECKTKVDEILYKAPTAPLPRLFVYNRVRQLIELFFSALLTKADVSDFKGDIKRSDIRKIMQVEQLMVKDFSQKPLTINQLARRATMSTTKLKRLFRQVFNKPLYEYYQEQRLQKAAELLSTGHYSVNEVARRIGYQNISNFSIAFKKHFGMSPVEFQHNRKGRAA